MGPFHPVTRIDRPSISGPQRARGSLCRSRKKTILFLALFSFLLLMARKDLQAETWVHVRWVPDGDTVFLSDHRRLRYIGINSPETAHGETRAEPHGETARRVNRDLVLGKSVRIEFDRERSDRYGRLLAYVFLEDGAFVNREMIDRGMAYFLSHPPNTRRDPELLEAQRAAMTAGKGIWRDWTEGEGSYIGNRRSRRFHRAACPLGKKVSLRNRVPFTRKWDAFWAGFAPAGGCLPTLRE